MASVTDFNFKRYENKKGKYPNEVLEFWKKSLVSHWKETKCRLVNNFTTN